MKDLTPLKTLKVSIHDSILFDGNGASAGVYKVKDSSSAFPKSVVMFFPNSPFKYPHRSMTIMVHVKVVTKETYEKECEMFLNKNYMTIKEGISFNLNKKQLKHFMNVHANVAKEAQHYLIVRYRSVIRLATSFYVQDVELFCSRLKKHYYYDHFYTSVKSVKEALKQFQSVVNGIKFITKRNMLKEYAYLLSRPKEYFELCSYFSGPCMWWVFKEDKLQGDEAKTFLDHVKKNLKEVDNFLYYGSPFTKGVVYPKRLKECMQLWKYMNGIPTLRIKQCIEMYEYFLLERNTNGNWIMDCAGKKEISYIDDTVRSSEVVDKTGETTIDAVGDPVEKGEEKWFSPKNTKTVLSFFTKESEFRNPVLRRIYGWLFAFSGECEKERMLFNHIYKKNTVLLSNQLSDNFKTKVEQKRMFLEYPNTCIKAEFSGLILKECGLEDDPASYDKEVKTKWSSKTESISVCFVLCDYFPLTKLNKLFQKWNDANEFYILFSSELTLVSAKDFLPNWRREIKDILKVYKEKGKRLFSQVEDGTQFSRPMIEDASYYEVDEGVAFVQSVDMSTSYLLVPNKGLKKELIDILRSQKCYYGFTDEKGKEYSSGYRKGSLIRAFGENPRLFQASKGCSSCNKDHQIVTLATVAEVSVFGKRENVYLIGGNWEENTKKAAFALSSKNAYKVTVKPSPESLWNFKEFGGKTERFKKRYNESALYWIAMENLEEEEKEAKERAKKKPDVLKHSTNALKRKSKELIANLNNHEQDKKVRVI